MRPWREDIQLTSPIRRLQCISEKPGVELKGHIISILDTSLLDELTDQCESPGVTSNGSLFVRLRQEIHRLLVSLPCSDCPVGKHPTNTHSHLGGLGKQLLSQFMKRTGICCPFLMVAP